MYPPFDYVRARTVEEALEAADEGSRFIAGGTDLMIAMRRGNASPRKLIDVSFIDEIRGVRLEEGRVWIGAATTHHEVSTSEILREKIPFLSIASGSVGGPQIRFMGTIGGNIVNASPAADTIPPLVCLDALLILRSKDGSREIPLKDFIVSPYRTIIKPHELLTGISFRIPEGSLKSAFVKVSRRSAMAISRLNMAALATFEGGCFKDVRISVGSMTPRPVSFEEARELLSGKLPSEDLFREASSLVYEKLKGISGERPSFLYKGPVVRDLVVRVLRDISGGVL